MFSYALASWVPPSLSCANQEGWGASRLCKETIIFALRAVVSG